MLQIGPHKLKSNILLAPMAGVSDAPFRRICQEMGAGLATSEMLTSDTRLWTSRKSSQRLSDCENESDTSAIKSMQIAGSDPEEMANAAKACADNGAQIVDINMGCPAKKVCKKAAGSSLLRDEKLVADILAAVVKAVDIPITLKIRTGWCPETRNGTTIAHIAEDIGIQALTVHGRTRACRFTGEAEYKTIAAIVNTVQIPVIANGDIDSPTKAAQVLKETGACAVMIGRSAQGQPWLIREIGHYLGNQELLPPPELAEIKNILLSHMKSLYQFYGEYLGVRIARKHMKWYLNNITTRYGIVIHEDQLRSLNSIESSSLQFASVEHLIERLITKEDKAA